MQNQQRPKQRLILVPPKRKRLMEKGRTLQ